MMLVAWLLIRYLTYLPEQRRRPLLEFLVGCASRSLAAVDDPNVFREAADQSLSCKPLSSMTHIFSLYQADPTRSLVSLLSNGFLPPTSGEKAESRRGGYNQRVFRLANTRGI